jgi:hypothetical protein
MRTSASDRSDSAGGSERDRGRGSAHEQECGHPVTGSAQRRLQAGFSSGLASGAASGAVRRRGPNDEQTGWARKRAGNRSRDLQVHPQARRDRRAPGAAQLETGADAGQPHGCERRSATQRRQPRGHEGVRRGNHSGNQPRAEHVGPGCAPGGEGAKSVWYSSDL